MSAEDCPFVVIRKENDIDKKDDSYIKFEIPIDPEDPDGLKSTMQLTECELSDAGSVLSRA